MSAAGKGSAHRGELEPALREGARRGKAQAHEHFPAEDKSAQKPGAGRACLLAHRKSHGRHHRSGVRDRGGMGGIIFERVHERAVAKRCRRSRHRGCEAEGRRIAPCSERGCERSQWAIAGQSGRGEADAQLIEKVDLG